MLCSWNITPTTLTSTTRSLNKHTFFKKKCNSCSEISETSNTYFSSIMILMTHLTDAVKQICHNYCSIGVFAGNVTSRDMFEGEDKKGRKQSAPERTSKHLAAAAATHWPTQHVGPSTGRRAAAKRPEMTRTQRTCGPGQMCRHDSSSSSSWLRGSRSTWVDSCLRTPDRKNKALLGSQHHCALPLRPPLRGPERWGNTARISVASRRTRWKWCSLTAACTGMQFHQVQKLSLSLGTLPSSLRILELFHPRLTPRS